MKFNLRFAVLPFLYLFLLISIGCNHPKSIVYDSQEQLESIVKRLINYDLKDKQNNAVLIILQNVDCICTDEDMELAKSFILSKKYSDYKFVIILKGEKHKFTDKIPKNKLKNIEIIHDKNNLFMNYGYISTTDRIIIYKEGGAVNYEDMHITKPSLISDKLLKI